MSISAKFLHLHITLKLINQIPSKPYFEEYPSVARVLNLFTSSHRDLKRLLRQVRTQLINSKEEISIKKLNEIFTKVI